MRNFPKKKTFEPTLERTYRLIFFFLQIFFINLQVQSGGSEMLFISIRKLAFDRAEIMRSYRNVF